MSGNSGERIEASRYRGRARDGKAGRAEMPDLGSWLQTLRRLRRDQETGRVLSREKAADLLGVSDSYVKQIERNRVVPSRGVVERFVERYELTPRQARYTRELAAPALELPTVDDLRRQLAIADRLDDLEFFDSKGVIYGVTDPVWNVVVGNKSFYQAMPGLHEEADDNVALWHFRPGAGESPAKHVAVDWHGEAVWLVAIIRAGLARFRGCREAWTVLRRLRASDEFNALWRDNPTAVVYSRGPETPCHMRDPDTGQPWTASIQISEIPDDDALVDPYLRVHQVRRREYAGPEL
ncbi:helix-turn-helix domain-containing protein [Nocardia sp. BMG51109]|uniref:helix-turn-helix domain-containing protein n=1 Tax=Nocardia sp. BMG51109 TaxID=1056816 RepID=UPI000462E98D|nr:helix-turn-helix domain-containing protein [Nocardia sp. BMG51109]